MAQRPGIRAKALDLPLCDALLPLARAASVVPVLRPAKLVALSSVGGSTTTIAHSATFVVPEEVALAATAGVVFCASAECEEEIDADGGMILFLSAKLASGVSITVADLAAMHSLLSSHSKGGAVYRLLGGDVGRKWCDQCCKLSKKKGIAEQQRFDEDLHPRGGDQQHPGRFSAGHGTAPEHSDEAAEHLAPKAPKGWGALNDLVSKKPEEDPADLARENKEAMDLLEEVAGAKWGDPPKAKKGFVETAKQKKKREAFIASFGPEYEEDRSAMMGPHRAKESELETESARIQVKRDTLEKAINRSVRIGFAQGPSKNDYALLLTALNDEIEEYQKKAQAFSDTPLGLTGEHMEVLKDYCRKEVAEVNAKHGISPEAEDEARGKFHAGGFQFPDNLMTREGQNLFGRHLSEVNLDKTGADMDLFQENRIRAMEFLGAAANMSLYGKALSIPLASMKSSFRAAALVERNGGGVIAGLAIGVRNPLQVFAHESGHVLEKSDPYHGEGQARASKFLKRRGIATGLFGDGEKQVPLRSVIPESSYDENETGAKDKFDETWKALGFSSGHARMVAYYTGKIYNDQSTETMSMGMEMLVEAPKEFATVDPEYFHYVIDGLSGRGLPQAMKNLGYWANRTHIIIPERLATAAATKGAFHRP